MRLIDADKLLRDIEDYNLSDGMFQHWVEIQNTIEPERKKGKWDFMGWQMFQCSECKHTFTQDFLEGWREYTYESHFPPFCPNCGAKMEEENV